MADTSETEPTLESFPARSFDKLRYADTDRQGHVNNAVFATLLETGRAEILHPEGGSLAAPGCAFVIVKLTLEFRAEINWPGRVEIGSRVTAVGRSSITLHQGLFQDGRLAGLADSVLVQMDETTRKSAPLPAATLAHLKTLTGAA